MNEPTRYKQHSTFQAAPDPERCAAQVSEPGRGIRLYQCTRKRKPGSEWCGQHHPEAIAERERQVAERRREKDRRDPIARALRRSAAYRELREAVEAALADVADLDEVAPASFAALREVLERHGTDPADKVD